MIEVTVASLGLDRTTNTPVVILREKEGAGVLPIWIGPAEASAIAMELQGMKAQRPLTHDLLKQILVGLGGDLPYFWPMWLAVPGVALFITTAVEAAVTRGRSSDEPRR